MQLSALQSLALSVAQARSPEHVLQEMVRGLGMTDGVALARVWLLEADATETVLRLHASVGLSRVNPDERWNRVDGGHARLPLNFGKVGLIASSGQGLLLQRAPDNWLVRPDWAEREGIESFAGQPLIFDKEVLGVVAIFSRRRLEREDLGWLRVFADHAAVAIANTRAHSQIAELRERLEHGRVILGQSSTPPAPLEMVAESAAMKALLGQVRAVARTTATVLISGESGVGKELVANAIHTLSPRAHQPLVKVNCASIPRELFESEFFGHVRGAFSGAARDREGRFQLADKGTLFLDEVGEIPLDLQGKLLRVLQEQEFEPVGDDRTRRVDVRVVTATNRSLEREVSAGRFRADLYYRLGVLHLHIPPLRERRADIAPLVKQYVAQGARRLNIPTPTVASADLAALERYDFPGNVRELRNILERALVLHPPNTSVLRIELELPTAPEAPVPAPQTEATGADASGARVLSDEEFRDFERANLLKALEQCSWRVAGRDGAAHLLGLSPSTLSYRMKALGISRPGG